MGQKVNPIGYRIGVNKNWNSRWNSKDPKMVAKWIVEDSKIRNTFINPCAKDRKINLQKKNYEKILLIDHIEIERDNHGKQILVKFFIGNIGVVNEQLEKEISLIINKIVGRKVKVISQFIEFGNTSWSAKIMARKIADAIEAGTPFRIAQKNVKKEAMDAKVKGIKTQVAGRLGGVEMARTEGYSEGPVPLTTLRSDLDYACAQAFTEMGIIGCKVWINRGEILKPGLTNQNEHYIKPIKNKDISKTHSHHSTEKHHNHETKGEHEKTHEKKYNHSKGETK